MICRDGQLPIHAEADFCITGYLDPARLKPEGPFGDHLGYYSLAHEFPVMRVEHVYHRRDAIWPFTVVGRPPQEDSIFGQLIHELVGPVIPKQIPGVRAVHAVDAAGVHPLLLAIGSERYVPYEERRRPRELLTLANALLGHGQLSLAKYLWIVAAEDNPELDVRDVPDFFRHVLGAGRLAARPALPDLHHDRHARLQQRPAERGLEGGDRGGRPAAADLAGGLRQPAGAARGVGIPAAAGGLAGHSGGGRAGRTRPTAERGRIRRSAQFCGCYNRQRRDQRFPLVVVVDQSDFAAQHAGELPLDHLHAEQSGVGHLRHRGVLSRQALGLFRLAGDRRPEQAAPCPAAGRRPGGHPARRRPGRPRRTAARDHLRFEGKEDGGKENERRESTSLWVVAVCSLRVVFVECS